MDKKIVLTGGHAGTTALATIYELKKDPQISWKISWIGPNSAFEGKNSPTIESKVFPQEKVDFYQINMGRLQRKFTFWTLPSLLKIPFGFWSAFNLILKIKPDIVLSFGGYASYPVVFFAWLLRIPVLIHEQTVMAGRANQAAAFFARKVILSREQSKNFFPLSKIEVVGNPLLPEILKIKPKNKISNPPTLLISGGSRGSKTINEVIGIILPKLLKDFKVIHLTGDHNFSIFSEMKDNLPLNLKNNYEVYSSFDPREIHKLYEKSDIIVGRAGANTVFEITAVKRPAILIPLPFSYLSEQKENALWAKRFGIAEVIEEDELTPQNLFEKIEKMKDDWEKIVKKASSQKSPDLEASQNLIKIIHQVLK